MEVVYFHWADEVAAMALSSGVVQLIHSFLHEANRYLLWAYCMPALFQAQRDRGDLAQGSEQDKSLVRLLSRACRLHDGSGAEAYEGPTHSLMLCCGHLDIQSFFGRGPQFSFCAGPHESCHHPGPALGEFTSRTEMTLNGTPISGHEKCYEEVN